MGRGHHFIGWSTFMFTIHVCWGSGYLNNEVCLHLHSVETQTLLLKPPKHAIELRDRSTDRRFLGKCSRKMTQGWLKTLKETYGGPNISHKPLSAVHTELGLWETLGPPNRFSIHCVGLQKRIQTIKTHVWRQIIIRYSASPTALFLVFTKRRVGEVEPPIKSS